MKSVFKTSLDFSAKMYPWHLLKHKSKLKKKRCDGRKLATFNAIVHGERAQSGQEAVAQLLVTVVDRGAPTGAPVTSKGVFLQLTPRSENQRERTNVSLHAADTDGTD